MRDSWPLVGGLIGLLHEPNRTGREVGNGLKDFFSRILGELEDFWNQTKGTGESSQLRPHRNSTVERPLPLQPVMPRMSSASSSPNWATAPPISTPPSSRLPILQAQPAYDQMRQLPPQSVPLSAPFRSSSHPDPLQPIPLRVANKVPSNPNHPTIKNRTPSAPNSQGFLLEKIPAQPVTFIASTRSPVHPDTLHTIPISRPEAVSPARVFSMVGQRSPSAAKSPLNLVPPSSSHSTQVSANFMYHNHVQPIASGPASTDSSSRLSTVVQQQNPHAAKNSPSSDKPPKSSLATSSRYSSYTFPKYDPPDISSFEDLVSSHLLPLPPLHSDTTVPDSGNPYHYFARRCHELQSTVQKMTAGEARRTLSRDEMVFWNKLRMSLASLLPVARSNGRPSGGVEEEYERYDTSRGRINCFSFFSGPASGSRQGGNGIDRGQGLR